MRSGSTWPSPEQFYISTCQRCTRVKKRFALTWVSSRGCRCVIRFSSHASLADARSDGLGWDSIPITEF
jgi:hypothetical protein